MIPPNWDSWGKIRVLREGFDVEAVSKGWSIDIESSKHSSLDTNGKEPTQAGNVDKNKEQHGSLSAYEESVPDPKKITAFAESVSKRGLDLEVLSNQDFLASQAELMERLKAKEEQQQEEGKGSKETPTRSSFISQHDESGVVEARGRVNEHIGPVQFNMGGIQVDAEDMLKRLKDRDRDRTPEGATPAADTPDGKSQNEALANFFAGLMKRGGSHSPRAHAT